MGDISVDNLSIKAYAHLQEVCIKCFKSKYTLMFKKWTGDIIVLDLSIELYLLLQEVCINCFKSKYMLVFYKMDGWHNRSRPKHWSVFTSTRGVYQLLQIQIYVSVIQNGLTFFLLCKPAWFSWHTPNKELSKCNEKLKYRWRC